jgi:hypothetical protein
LILASVEAVFAEEEAWDRRTILRSGDASGMMDEAMSAPDGFARAGREPAAHADVARYGLDIGPAIALLRLPDGFAEPTGSREPSRERASPDTICPVLENEAKARGLPAVFFARLIWQESRFDPDAVSPKGAQGIAQFMPYTAAERGLTDPFDPVSALAESARFLRDLLDEFGNLGLAAAAYNAGPQRVRNWLAGRAVLPFETEDYVLAITGRAAADWLESDAELPDLTLPEVDSFQAACRTLAAIIKRRPPGAGPAKARWRPWGVQLAGGFSEAKALAAFARMKKQFGPTLGAEAPMVVRSTLRSRGTRPLYAVRLGADSRDAADQLCARLRAAGGACMVVKN